MCKCGCNTCDTIKGPILTEGKVKKLVSENLQYHIDNNISLMENEFRIGSDAHLRMILEARKLYSRGVLDLCEEDKDLMKTHLGEFALYENEIVPLDLPMVNEEVDEVSMSAAAGSYLTPYAFVRKRKKRKKTKEGIFHRKSSDYDRMYTPQEETEDMRSSGAGIDVRLNEPWFKVREAVQKALLNEGKKKKKKEKKDPPIGKPKRGGPKAYYVYVRDPKTKRIKKVTFGSGGLRAKIRNPKARKAFAKRHRCSEKNDRTKASYWSCRLPRYASQLGLGANMNTFW